MVLANLTLTRYTCVCTCTLSLSRVIAKTSRPTLVKFRFIAKMPTTRRVRFLCSVCHAEALNDCIHCDICSCRVIRRIIDATQFVWSGMYFFCLCCASNIAQTSFAQPVFRRRRKSGGSIAIVLIMKKRLVPTGWLKMTDMKMTDHQNCRTWNCRTKLQC